LIPAPGTLAQTTAKETTMKIVPSILAVVLLGSSAIHVSFAEAAASTAGHAASSNPSTAPSGSPPPASHARRMPAPGVAKPIARNAIGLPVTRHEGLQERSSEPHGAPAQSPTHDAPSVAASGAGNLAKTDGGLERPPIVRPSPSPVVSAPVAQRGTINGTGLTRPSSAPSSLGGPAKVVVGINGTSARPKHP
jgi:hypothetical protein